MYLLGPRGSALMSLALKFVVTLSAGHDLRRFLSCAISREQTESSQPQRSSSSRAGFIQRLESCRDGFLSLWGREGDCINTALSCFVGVGSSVPVSAGSGGCSLFVPPALLSPPSVPAAALAPCVPSAGQAEHRASPWRGPLQVAEQSQ